MKKAITLIVGTLLVSTAFAGQKVDVNNKPVEMSYLQSASQTDIKPVAGQADTYIIKLRNVAPFTTYFSDRPNRVVGQIETATFLTSWKIGSNSFSKDAPNAILSGVIKSWTKGSNVNLVMELTAPVYDPVKHTVAYQAHLLKNATTPAMNFNQLRYTTLFIDSGVCLSCIGG